MAIFLMCYAIVIARLICYTFHCSKDIPWLVVVNLQSLLFLFNSVSNSVVYAFLKQDICRQLKHFVQIFAHRHFLQVVSFAFGVFKVAPHGHITERTFYVQFTQSEPIRLKHFTIRLDSHGGLSNTLN